MRGRVNAIRTFKGLVADLRFISKQNTNFAGEFSVLFSVRDIGIT